MGDRILRVGFWKVRESRSGTAGSGCVGGGGFRGGSSDAFGLRRGVSFGSFVDRSGGGERIAESDMGVADGIFSYFCPLTIQVDDVVLWCCEWKETCPVLY